MHNCHAVGYTRPPIIGHLPSWLHIWRWRGPYRSSGGVREAEGMPLCICSTCVAVACLHGLGAYRWYFSCWLCGVWATTQCAIEQIASTMRCRGGAGRARDLCRRQAVYIAAIDGCFDRKSGWCGVGQNAAFSRREDPAVP